MRGRGCLDIHQLGCVGGVRNDGSEVAKSIPVGVCLPVDGRSPNWTICLSETPVAGKLA